MNPKELNVILVDPFRILMTVKDPFVTTDVMLCYVPFFMALSRA